MGQTFKKVPPEQLEWQVQPSRTSTKYVYVDIQKDLESIKFSENCANVYNKKAFANLLKKVEKQQNNLLEASKKINKNIRTCTKLT